MARSARRVGAPLRDPGRLARVGKWVYKRGPGDSISTHDPTFIPIANGPSQTSVICTRVKKKREGRQTEKEGQNRPPRYFVLRSIALIDSSRELVRERESRDQKQEKPKKGKGSRAPTPTRLARVTRFTEKRKRRKYIYTITSFSLSQSFVTLAGRNSVKRTEGTLTEVVFR